MIKYLVITKYTPFLGTGYLILPLHIVKMAINLFGNLIRLFVHLNVTEITIPLIKSWWIYFFSSPFPFFQFVHFPLYAFRPCATIFNTYTYIVKEVLRTHNDNRYKGMFLEREALFTLYVVKIVACEIFLFIKTCTQYLHAF